MPLAEALTCHRHTSSYCKLLNGDWLFHWSPTPSAAPPDFYQPAHHPTDWATIAVPGNWQLQPGYTERGSTGSNPPIYSDAPTPLTLPTCPPRPCRRQSHRLLPYHFMVPADWAGRSIFLTFDGVQSAFHLWVNGQAVGYSQDKPHAAELSTLPLMCSQGRICWPSASIAGPRAAIWRIRIFWRLSGDLSRCLPLGCSPATCTRFCGASTNLAADYVDATLHVPAPRFTTMRQLRSPAHSKHSFLMPKGHTPLFATPLTHAVEVAGGIKRVRLQWRPPSGESPAVVRRAALSLHPLVDP